MHIKLKTQKKAYDIIEGISNDDELTLLISELNRLNNLNKLFISFEDELYNQTKDFRQNKAINDKSVEECIECVRSNLLQQEQYKELRYYLL